MIIISSIIIEQVAQLRQHKQRINDLRTQLGADEIHTITMSATEAKHKS